MQGQRHEENLANQMDPVPASYPVTGVDGGLFPMIHQPVIGHAQESLLPATGSISIGGSTYPATYPLTDYRGGHQHAQLAHGTNHDHGSYQVNAQDLGALPAAPLAIGLYYGNGLTAQTRPNGVIQTPGLIYSNTGNSGALPLAPLAVNIGYGNGLTDPNGLNGTTHTHTHTNTHTPGPYHFNAQDLGTLSTAPLATDLGYWNSPTAPDGPNGTNQYSGLSQLNIPGFGASSVTPLPTNLDFGDGSTAQTYPSESFPEGQSLWNPGMVPAMNGTLSSNGMAAGGYEAPTMLPMTPFMTAHPHGGLYADNYNPMIQGATDLADWGTFTQPLVDTSTNPIFGTSFATQTPLASTAPAVAGNGRFPCTQPNCNQTFGRNYELIRHEGSVHGINGRTHLCPITGCPRSQCRQFSRADKVTEHLWKVHGNLGFFKRV